MKCIIINVVLIALLMATATFTVKAQADITPPSPTAYEFSKYGQAATGSHTGTNTLSIPLQAFSTGRIQVPLSLTYSSNGIKVDQLSSNVGLGWSLNAGGVISRIIRDEADEENNLVFPRDARENNGIIDPAVLDYFNLAGMDYADSEPDLFSFNFAGYSGQFVFDENGAIVQLTNNVDLKIIREGSSQMNFNFKIVDPEGITYRFEEQERSRMRAEGNGHTIPGPESTTAWYLTKIEHPLGDEVFLDYNVTSYDYIIANAQTVTVHTNPFTNCSGTGTSNPPTISPVISNRLHIVGKQLVQIRGNSPTYGTIEIEYNEGHGGINDYKLVTDIIINDGNGSMVENIHFNYLRTTNSRVFLKEVTSINPKHNHQFDYISPNDFPARLDKGQDHWGFYNGENNQYYFPKPSTIDHSNSQLNTVTVGAIKSPVASFAEKGLLQRVHYPTGGFTEFEYDGNSYQGTTVVSPPPKNVNLSVATDIANNGVQEDKVTLTGILVNQDVYVGHSVFFNSNTGTGCDPNHDLGKSRITISVIDLTNPSSTNLLYSTHLNGPQFYPNHYTMEAEDYDPSNPVNLYLRLEANHDYEVKLQANWFCTDGAAGFNYFEGQQTTISEEKLSGGLRLTKIKNYESASHLATQTKIYYGSQLDLTTPSSQKPPTPYYLSNITQRVACTIPCDYIDKYYKVLNTNSVRNLYESQTGTMMYRYVTVSEGGNNFENGGIEYEYIIKPGGEGNPLFGDFIHNVPRTNKSWDNGLLKQSTIFGKNSTTNALFPVSKTLNEYTHTTGKEVYAHLINKKFDHVCSANVTYTCTSDDVNDITYSKTCVTNHNHFWAGTLNPFHKWWICVAAGADMQWYVKSQHPCYNKPIGTIIIRPDMLENYDITEYKYFEQRFHLSKTTTTTYDENGQHPITDIVSHTFDPTYKNVKSTKNWRDVNGNGFQDPSEDYTYTAYSYIYDNVGGNANTLMEMMNQHMVGIPTQTLVHSNSTTSNLMDGSSAWFKSITRNGKTLIVPEVSLTVMGSSGLSPVSQNLNWNNDGRPIRTQAYKLDFTLDDNYTEILWQNDLVDKVRTHSDLGVQETNYDYNAFRQLSRVTDHNGVITEYEYDALQRLWKIKTGYDDDDFRKTSTYNYYYNPSSSNNQVLTTVTFTDSSFLAQSTRTFIDGLGREVSVQKDEYSPNYEDVTLFTNTYDDYGRIQQKSVLGQGTTIYEYEQSPLSRLLTTTTGAGTISQSFGSNASTIYIDGKPYPVGSLSKVSTTDYKGHNSESYTDFLGRDIQSVNHVTLASAGLQDAKTSQVYNDLGQLVKIIPPQGAIYEYEYNNKGMLSKTTIPDQGTTEHYYDKLGRKVIDKDVNGHDLGVVYDDLGRVIQTGDAPAPSSGLNTYFDLGTLVLSNAHNTTTYKSTSGNPIDWIDYTTTVDMSSLSSTPVYYTTTYSDYDGFGRAWTISTENHKGGVEEIELTYNDADIVTETIINHNTGNSNFGQQFNYTIENTFDHSLRPNKTYITPPYSNIKQVISDLNYNDKDQVIQKRMHGDDNSAWQTIDYTYDSLGRITKINDAAAIRNIDCDKKELCDLTFRFHPLNSQGNTSIVIEDLFFMGDDGKESAVLTNINYPFTLHNNSKDQLMNAIEAFMVLQEYVFDDIDIDDDLKGLTISQTNARYTQINYDQTIAYKSNGNCCNTEPVGDLFAEFTFYESQGNNIDRLIWTVPCGGLSTYYLQYDEMDRLLDANYYERQSRANAWQNTQAYNMSATYDLMGNIQTLKRNGRVNGNVAAIDDLQYAYAANSNKLVQVTDGIGPDFVNHGQKGGGAIFLYDAKGNIINDLGKHIEFTYNQYALPSRIYKSFNTNNEILNTYLGTQARVQKTTHENGKTTVKDYIGSVEYLTKDGVTKVEAIYHAEGRITLDHNNSTQFEYSIKDHLGNSRVNFTDKNKDGIISKSDIIQENHFYPFGMTMEGDWVQTYGRKNQYQYNGKELDSDLGVDLMNYGARFYDAALGRWTTIDPLAKDFSNWSPYNYVMNNPIILVDPDGRNPALGAAIGAVVGGGLYLASAYMKGEEVDKTKLVAAAMGGAVSGAMLGMGNPAGLAAMVETSTFGSAVTGTAINLVVGGSSAATGDMVQQGIEIAGGVRTEYNLQQTINEAAMGSMMNFGPGAVTGALTSEVKDGVGRKAIEPLVTNPVTQRTVQTLSATAQTYMKNGAGEAANKDNTPSPNTATPQSCSAVTSTCDARAQSSTSAARHEENKPPPQIDVGGGNIMVFDF